MSKEPNRVETASSTRIEQARRRAGLGYLPQLTLRHSCCSCAAKEQSGSPAKWSASMAA